MQGGGDESNSRLLGQGTSGGGVGGGGDDGGAAGAGGGASPFDAFKDIWAGLGGAEKKNGGGGGSDLEGGGGGDGGGGGGGGMDPLGGFALPLFMRDGLAKVTRDARGGDTGVGAPTGAAARWMQVGRGVRSRSALVRR